MSELPDISTGPRSEFQDWVQQQQPRPRPYYEIYPNIFVIHDLVWGDEEIGDQPYDEVLLDILHTDLMKRTMAIEQLSLYSETATIPNTGIFSRWEHAWGSVVFVRKLTEDEQLEPRERLILQLRTLLSDFGHTAYSHQGDFEFQGTDGPQNLHDEELKELLEASEVKLVLDHHGITIDEVIFPDVVDWIERPGPDLCVDRVDYAVREFKRWLDIGNSLGRVTNINAYSLRDGHIVLADREVATEFAKSFLLLPTEHWGEPVHKIQEHFQRALIRHGLLNENLLAVDSLDRNKYHPYDLLRTVDADVTRSAMMGSEFAANLMAVMRSIGAAKRDIFLNVRRDELSEYLLNNTAEFPNPIEHYGFAKRLFGSIPLLPSNVEVEPIGNTESVRRRAGAFSTYLSPFKTRSVDPLFIDEHGEVQRLSEVDDDFKQLLQQQLQFESQAYTGYVYLGRTVRKLIIDVTKRDDQEWKQMLRRPRMPADVLRRCLGSGGNVAVMYRLIDVDYMA